MKYLVIVLTILTLSSCVKDKLEQDTLILEGTWKWNHSLEYTYDSVNDSILVDTVWAASYPDTYALRFEEKGKVYTIKNDSDEDKYRIVLPYFKFGLCSELHNSYEYKINLNNKEDNTLEGCVNKDTIVTNDIHLPISKGTTEYPYYKHFFLK